MAIRPDRPNRYDASLGKSTRSIWTVTHDKAVGALLNELTQAAFVHPETGARMIYELA
jgi:hypothetical protein